MKKSKWESGIALVEMAIVLPLLLLLLLGTIDFGRVFYQAVTVANVARAGASYGSLDEARSKDLSGIQQAALQEAQDIDGVSVMVERFCQCADGSPMNCDGVCPEGVPRIYVKVIAAKTFRTIVPYPGIPDPVNIDREVIMRAL